MVYSNSVVTCTNGRFRQYAWSIASGRWKPLRNQYGRFGTAWGGGGSGRGYMLLAIGSPVCPPVLQGPKRWQLIDALLIIRHPLVTNL